MDQILQYFKLLESQRKVRILYLCEFGSRVKGYGREISDYDIVGVFVDDALDAYWKREIFPEDVDHITGSTEFKVTANDDGNNEHVHVDFALWHLTKAIRLLFTKRNYSLLLWCKSTIKYIELEEFTHFREFLFNTVQTIRPSVMYGWARNSCHYCTTQLIHQDENVRRKALKSILVAWYQLLMMLLVTECNTIDTLDMFAEFRDKKETVFKKWIEFIPADKREELFGVRKSRESDENIDESTQKLIEELLKAAENLIGHFDYKLFENNCVGLTFDERWNEEVAQLIKAGLRTSN